MSTADALNALVVYAIVLLRISVYLTPVILAITTVATLRRNLALLGEKIADLSHNTSRSTAHLVLSLALVAVLIIPAITVRSLVYLVFPVVAAFYVSTPVQRYFVFPYLGVYRNGVMFPDGPFYYRKVHSWQTNGDQFFVRTQSGGRSDFTVCNDQGNFVATRFRELGLSQAEIVASLFFEYEP